MSPSSPNEHLTRNSQRDHTYLHTSLLPSCMRDCWGNMDGRTDGAITMGVCDPPPRPAFPRRPVRLGASVPHILLRAFHTLPACLPGWLPQQTTHGALQFAVYEELKQFGARFNREAGESDRQVGVPVYGREGTAARFGC